MISLHKVTKSFASKKALDEVSFEINYGDIVGFLGPNGAGKTTTMRLVTGHLNPTFGKVTVDKLSPIDDRIKVVNKIGYLPENNPLYLDMKTNDYLNFVASIKSAQNVDEVVENVGLNDYLNAKIENLSRGYRQRVGLASALLANPPILVLDEPTSGLDPIEQDKMKQLIKKIAKDKIVIFSTHILSEVEEIANRIIILNKGHLVYNDTKPAGKNAVDTLFKKVII